MNIKLVLTDIDGVWTDGGMYYDERGNEWKRFNTYDSAGVIWCRKLGIEVGILTSETTSIVERRAAKLGINIVHQGVGDKLQTAKEICLAQGITLDEVAYLGDDINDIQLLKATGLTACPRSAPAYVQQFCHKVMDKKGGEGVFRDFVEAIIPASELDKLIAEYF